MALKVWYPMIVREAGIPLIILSAYVERVVKLPSVQRTLSDPEKLEEVYDRYLRNESESEVAKSTRAGRLLP